MPPWFAVIDDSTFSSHHDSGQRAVAKQCRAHDEGDQHGAARTRRARGQHFTFGLGAGPPRVSAKRLFVSIELPVAIVELLVGLDPKMRGVRWLTPAQMHLTL